MSSSSACPLGQHYVKDHTRRTRKSGVISVSAHCRVNPKEKEKLLHASNIRHLYYNRLQKIYPKLPAIKGFKGFHKYDPMIQFWVKYWKDKKRLPKEVDPLLIKAMIAAESSFQPGVRTKDPKSTATGLMQLTGSTLKTLKGNPDEKGYIEVKDESYLFRVKRAFRPTCEHSNRYLLAGAQNKNISQEKFKKHV